MEKFYPVKPEKEVISMRISTSVLQEVDQKANEFGISRNELINQCIDNGTKKERQEKQNAAAARGSGDIVLLRCNRHTGHTEERTRQTFAEA